MKIGLKKRRLRKFQLIGGRYARVEFVCTPEQKGRYEARAAEECKSLSAWLVRAADDAVLRGTTA